MVSDLIFIHIFNIEVLIGGKNIFIFELDNSISVHVNKKKKNNLILGEGPIQRLNSTKITAINKFLFTSSL